MSDKRLRSILHYFTVISARARISGRAYGTVVSLIRDAAQKGQMIHNAEVEQIETKEIIGDEMWSYIKKTEELRQRRFRNGRLLDRN